MNFIIIQIFLLKMEEINELSKKQNYEKILSNNINIKKIIKKI